MSRLQTIENALASINETVFQELCDSFLILKMRIIVLFRELEVRAENKKQ